jgi:predicted methyltransferase
MRRCVAYAVFLFIVHMPAVALGVPAKPPAYVMAAIADPHRPKSDTDRDADRKPVPMLTFSGVKPGFVIAELVPGAGYTTRLLSAAVGPKGHVYSINPVPPSERLQTMIKPLTEDPAYTNVSVSDQQLSTLRVPENVDMVWTSQNYHDFKNPGVHVLSAGEGGTPAMNKAIYAALKPGGIYIVIDHAAEAGSGIRDAGTLHRVDPEVVRKEVLAAGFVFVGESKAFANSTDTHKTHSDDKTDKFFFKFRKPG